MLRKALFGALAQVETILDAIARQSLVDAQQLFLDSRSGPHLRHIHDHFLAMLDGLDEGVIDYNRRHRESPEEHDADLTAARLEMIRSALAVADLGDRPVQVISEIDCFVTANARLDSTLHRELLFLINHTIHHAAFIKAALAQRGIGLPEYIGLAPGTASYLRAVRANTPAVCAH